MLQRRVARFTGGPAHGITLDVDDLPRMMWLRKPPGIDMELIDGDRQLATEDALAHVIEQIEAFAYVLERTEMIDGAEVGTYSLF